MQVGLPVPQQTVHMVCDKQGREKGSGGAKVGSLCVQMYLCVCLGRDREAGGNGHLAPSI